MSSRLIGRLLGLLTIVVLAGPATPARAGIVIADAEVQPIGDPHYLFYYNIAVPAFSTMRQYDAITVFDIPIIGGNLDVVQYGILPLSGAYAGVFTFSFDRVGLYNQPIGGQPDDPTLYNLTFIYVGQSTIDNSTSSGNLVLRTNSFGFRTIDFGPTTSAIINTIEMPTNFISYAVTPTTNPDVPFAVVPGSQNNPGVVRPRFVPEPSSFVLTAVGVLGLTTLGRRAARRRA